MNILHHRSFGFGFILSLATLATLLVGRSNAASYAWTGSANDGSWDNGTNWSSGSPGSDDNATLNFTSSGDYNPVPTNDITNPTFKPYKISFASGVPGFTLGGNALSFNNGSLGAGIFSNTANAVTIGNALSWTGDKVFSLNSPGAGGLVFTGGISCPSGGTLAVGLGSVTYSAGTLSTGSGAKLYVGNSGPATLTIQDSATVTVDGELDVNYQATRTGDTGILALKTGTLSVSGQSYIGRAQMDGGSSDYNAKFLQTGGTATFSSLATVGYLGTAKSLFDTSGGTTNANAGLLIGRQGNGWMTIHGTGIVNVSGGSGLVVGQDTNRATSGTVELSGGTLSVTGNLTLGSDGGIGTFSRTGGSLTVSGASAGNLIAGGTGTLILNGSGGSVATTFGGTLSREGVGTLVVVPYTNNLGTTEAVTFSGGVSLVNNVIGPWAVRQTSGSNTSGDYLTASGNSLATASYTDTNFSAPTSTSLENITGSPAGIDNTTIHAMKVSGTATVNTDQTLTLAGGGMILNGGTVTGGTVAFEGGVGDVPALIYAGSNSVGTVISTLKTTAGLVKFGPGTLVLFGSNADLSGTINVNSGTLNIQNDAALGADGSGNGVTVAAGAALELQGDISIGDKPLALGGSGINNNGALRNVQDDNSYAGAITLTCPTQITIDAGSLTLTNSIQGSYSLKKTGNGMLTLAGNSASFGGTTTVAGGTLTVQSNGALGSLSSTSGTTVNNGATLAIEGNVSGCPEPLTISGAGVGNTGVLRNIQGSNTFSGPITLAANSQVTTDAGTLTLSGKISGGYGLAKAGSGTLVISNTGNNFTGSLTVTEGILSVAALNDSGTAGLLGSGTTPVVLGSSGKTATLFSTGSSTSSNRAFTAATNGIAAFQTNNAMALSGAIDGIGELWKTGTGTLTLTGNSDLFYGSTTVQSGTLTIDASGTPKGSLAGTSSNTVNAGATLHVTAGGTSSLINQLPNASNVTLNAGTLEYVGNGSFTGGEEVGALVLNPGQSNITTSRSTGGNTPYLRFASGPSSHATGATVNFSSTNSQIQILANPPGPGDGNIVGGYAFFNNADFATRTTASPYVIEQYTGYVTDPGTATAASNLRPTANVTITANKTFNSLNLTGSYGVTINGGTTLTLGSGGLIANTTGTISGGGTLNGSSGGELVVNTVQNFTIGSVIANNGSATALVKTGSEKLTLSGLNTFTGKTYINQGILEYAQTSNSSYGGEIIGVGTSMTLLKTQNATLTLTGASPSYSGAITVNGGKLQVDNSLGNVNTVTTVNNGGTLGGSGTIGGNATLNSGGTIDLTGGIGGTLTANSGSWTGTGSVVGKTTVSTGTLTIGNGSQAGNLHASGGLEVANSASIAKGAAGGTITGDFLYTSTAATNFSGTIAGSDKTVTVDNSDSVLTLSGSNTYTGGTSVIVGTLKAGHADALGSGGLFVGADGIFDLNDFDISVPSLSGAAGGVITDSTATAGTSTLTVDIASGESHYEGTFSDNATRQLDLIKSGEGLFVCSAININGNVTVSEGSMTVASITCGTLTIGSGAKATISPREMGVGQALVADRGPVSVPEPGIITLLVAALAAFGVLSFRRYRFFNARNTAGR